MTQNGRKPEERRRIISTPSYLGGIFYMRVKVAAILHIVGSFTFRLTLLMADSDPSQVSLTNADSFRFLLRMNSAYQADFVPTAFGIFTNSPTLPGARHR